MSQNELPQDAKRLIADHITSVEQLEILLLLHGQPDQQWSVKAVAEQMRTSEQSAASRLADLEARGFLKSSDGLDATYRFLPADPRRAREVDELAQVYGERRYTVIDLIFSKPIDNLRVYADAFRFRKDDSDG